MENILFLNLDIVQYNEAGKVTIGSSIFILVFSMIVVFVVLLIISYMIDIMHFILSSKTKSTKVVKDVVAKAEESVSGEYKMNSTLDDTRLVAVITAAISSYMGTSSDSIHIKSIRRVSQNNSNWATKSILNNLG